MRDADEKKTKKREGNEGVETSQYKVMPGLFNNLRINQFTTGEEKEAEKIDQLLWCKFDEGFFKELLIRHSKIKEFIARLAADEDIIAAKTRAASKKKSAGKVSVETTELAEFSPAGEPLANNKKVVSKYDNTTFFNSKSNQSYFNPIEDLPFAEFADSAEKYKFILYRYANYFYDYIKRKTTPEWISFASVERRFRKLEIANEMLDKMRTGKIFKKIKKTDDDGKEYDELHWDLKVFKDLCQRAAKWQTQLSAFENTYIGKYPGGELGQLLVAMLGEIYVKFKVEYESDFKAYISAHTPYGYYY